MDETFDDILAAFARLPGRAGVARPVVATLVDLPRRTSPQSRKVLGRRAIFLEEADTFGTEVLGSVTLGGCAEGALQKAAQQVRETGQSQLLEVDLGGDEAYEFGMTCAGAAAVQLTPTPPQSALWQAAAQARARGEVLRLVTPLGAGAVPFLLTAGGTLAADGQPDPSLVQQARKLPATAATAAPIDGAFYEVRPPPAELVVVGAGPIAPPLARLARTLGFRVTVCDDRPRRLTAQRLPDAHALLPSRPDEDLRLPPLSRRSNVVIISHDYAHEVPVLRQVLGAGVPYVAMVAGRRRGQAVLHFLEETGTPPHLLANVRTPAGLDLGGASPASIALSILAEVVALREGGAALGHSLSGVPSTPHK